MKQKSAGAVQSFVSLKFLRTYLFPLPPLAEQRHIASKVNKLMALCDDLEARKQKNHQACIQLNDASIDKLLTAPTPAKFSRHWRRIANNFDLLYGKPENVSKLRQAILQLAVQGKLVKQDPKDEPASNLVEPIALAKSAFLAERNLKLRKVDEREDIAQLKYEVPNSWAWFLLKDVAFFQEGPGIRNWQFKSSGIKLLNVSNIMKNGDLDFSNSDKHVSVKEFESKYRHFLIEEGDLLFASSGASWGKISWYVNPGYKVMLNTSTIRLRFYSELCEPQYLYHYLSTVFFKKQMTLQLVGMQPNFGSTHLSRVYIPMPPQKEQKRIVAKVDELMALCDNLEAKLIKGQAKSGKLLEAAVADLLAA
jgi:type I restriction enzyme S subunit